MTYSLDIEAWKRRKECLFFDNSVVKLAANGTLATTCSDVCPTDITFCLHRDVIELYPKNVAVYKISSSRILHFRPWKHTHKATCQIIKGSSQAKVHCILYITGENQ